MEKPEAKGRESKVDCIASSAASQMLPAVCRAETLVAQPKRDKRIQK